MQRENVDVPAMAVRPSLREIDDPAALLSPDLKIIEANRAYTHRFAGPGGEVVGRYCYRLGHTHAHPCGGADTVCPVQQVLETGIATDVIHEHFTPIGKRMVQVRVEPIHRADGSIAYLLKTLHDIPSRTTLPQLLGRSPAFHRMMALVERVAPSDTPVLFLGESGTGKELVASELHRRSKRRQHPFVPVDCSGLPESLFESELFGHERAAFTGATQTKRGLVEAATKGTLFLDEIGDVPLPQQVKLLRLLETGMFRRVGSVEQKHADFRLVCATHRDLRKMVEQGSFRRDLYYRISAFPISLPPLRDRIEDVALIAEELMQRPCCEKEPCTLSPEALRALERYSFPGNVRELLNILQRAKLLADDHVIRPEHLSDEVVFSHSDDQGRRDLQFSGRVVPLDEAEGLYLRWALATFGGDRRTLAQALGISERTLYRRLSPGVHLNDS